MLDQREKKALRLLATTDLSVSEIGRRTGWSEGKVHKLRKRAGLRSITRQEMLEAEADNEAFENAIRMVASGVSTFESAMIWSVDESALRFRCLRRKVDVTPKVQFVYSLVCPLTNRTRYVGLSARPSVRLTQHEQRGTMPIREWIRHLTDNGAKPVLSILERCDMDSGFVRERHWINALLASGQPLLNRK